MLIRVAITDDHILITESLEKALRSAPHITVTDRYDSGENLIEGLKKQQPDVLLLDYHLPDTNGAQLARYISYHYPKVSIIILTGFDKPGLATEMLECGCMGYLMKSTAGTETIIEAINRVWEGHIFLDNALRDKYMTSVRRGTQKSEHEKPRLTQRELEILRCIAEELSSQEIADKLCLSKRTVDNHRNSIMIKSGAKNTVGLIKYAYELKLI